MDKIIRATAADGFVKMAVITARDTVERARQIHALSPTACAALGRTLCGASLLGQAMKEENATLTIRINGGGPIGSVVAVSDCEGNVRGYVENPAVELPLRPDGKLNVGGAVGRDGMLTVSRDIGLREPYIGSVELVSGEIAEDLTSYLLERAGGFLVQLMPGAEDELIGKLEDNIFMMDQLTTVLDEDGAQALFDQVLRGFEWHTVGEYPVAYRCYCSRARVEQALTVIDPAELREIIAEGKPISVSCQFCDREYSFTPEELAALPRPGESEEK